MGYPSFADVKQTIVVENGIHYLKCIGYKRNTPCPNPLIDQRIANAKVLLQRDIVDLEELERLNVVLYLLCAACQITDTQRKKVKAKWQPENLGLELWRKGLRSPASLRPSRSVKLTRGSRTQEKRRVALTSRSSTSCNHWHHQDTAGSPCENHARRHHYTASAIVPHVMEEPENESNQDASELESVTTMVQTPNQGSTVTRQSKSTLFGEPLHHLSETQRFHRGRWWRYAPCTLRLKVLHKLFEPISSDTGFVYAVPVAGTQIVKIGKTTASTEKRIEAICKDCKLNLDAGGARWSPRIPRWEMNRLEEVVHLALASRQLDLLDEKPKRQVHHEFFEVDLDDAEQCVNKWLWRIQSVELEPERHVDPTIQQIIQDSIVGVDKPPSHINSQDGHERNEASSDQQRQEEIWDTAFRHCQGGYKKLSQLKEMVSSLGIVVSLLIAFLLPLPQAVSSCVAFGLAKAWCTWMDGAKHFPPLLFWKNLWL